MKSSKHIEHKGVVSSVEDGHVKVDIQPESACSACHAKSNCSVSNDEKKVIDIYNIRTNYKTGDFVTVKLEESLGFKALILGYLVPFVFVLITLIVVFQLTNNELMAGVIGISTMVPYYLMVYFFRDKLDKKFSFTLAK